MVRLNPPGAARPAAPPDARPAARPLLAAGLVLAGAALFGTVGTAQALGPDLPPAELAAARLLLAAVLFLVVAAGPAARGLGAVGAAWRQAPTWWAGVGQAGFNLCFLAAMREAGVAVGTLVAIGAAPVITGLVTRQVTRRWAAATAVAVTGLGLLVGGQLAGSDPPSVVGVLLALGAAASYATYIIAGNAAAARGLPVTPYLGAAFTVAAALTLPLLLAGDVGPLLAPGGLLLLGYLALVPTLLAYQLFNRGLHGVPSGTAATLGLIEPVVAASLAFLVLGERLSATGLVGAVLVLLGLLLIVRASARAGRPSGPEPAAAPGATGAEPPTVVGDNARRA